MEKLQSLIKDVLEITYGKYGAQYRKHLIENDTQSYYTLMVSGELYDRIAEKDREGEHKEIHK